MRVTKTPLDGVLIIEPDVHGDERGFFLENYQIGRYRDAGINDVFVQDNLSRSLRGVLRGLHFRINEPQAQLVTVMRGRIFDVTVDLRNGSPTYGRSFGVELSDDGPRQVFMAPGFAHGFCVLSGVADLHYKVSAAHDASDEGGVAWNDSDLGIAWPLRSPILSARDGAWPRLRELTARQLPNVAVP